MRKVAACFKSILQHRMKTGRQRRWENHKISHHHKKRFHSKILQVFMTEHKFKLLETKKKYTE